MFAQRLGVFVPLDEVPDVWHGVVQIFRDYGYRRLRHRARLKFLVADWGVEKFREVLETEYLHRRLTDGPRPEAPPQRRDHVGVHRQKDGRYYVGVAPTVGRVSGTTLAAVADLVEAAGSDRVRLTAQQKLIVLDVAERPRPRAAPTGWRTSASTRVPASSGAARWRAPASSSASSPSSRPRPSPPPPSTSSRRGCPRSTHRCRSTSTAARTPAPASRSPTSGSRARSSATPTVESVEGFQVHLGGASGRTPAFGRKPRGLKVTSAELPLFVERVARRYAEQRERRRVVRRAGRSAPTRADLA